MTGRTRMVTVQTPEGISFPLFVASPLTRGLALMVDRACMAVVVSILAFICNWFELFSRDFAGALSMILIFLVTIGYHVALEWLWRGQTFGKRLLGLRVMDAEGLRLQFSQVLVRNLLRFVDSLPLYLVGGLSSFISPRGQRLGDLAAGTIVVRAPSAPEPDLDQVMNRKFNSFRSYPHLAARLRQRTAPPEAALAQEAVVRRDQLDAEARVDLFRDIREHFEGIAAFPLEARDGISDEQYVRNVVDVLYR